MCSRWYRSQFNKFEKAWARVEILCLDFQKTPSNQNIKSSKVPTFKIYEIFSNHYFSALALALLWIDWQLVGHVALHWNKKVSKFLPFANYYVRVVMTGKRVNRGVGLGLETLVNYFFLEMQVLKHERKIAWKN